MSALQDTGERRVSMWELTQAAETLEDLIEAAQEAGEELTAEAMYAALEATEGQIVEKIGNILPLLASCTARHEARKGYKRSLDELNRVDDNKVARLRGLIAYAMARRGLDKAETVHGTVTLKKPQIELGEVDDQAAFEAGVGASCTLTLSADYTSAEAMRTLAKAALAGAADGERLCLSVTVTTGSPEIRDRWTETAKAIDSPVHLSYDADKAALAILAEQQIEASGADDPEPPEPLIPAEVCQPKLVRGLMIRGAK